MNLFKKVQGFLTLARPMEWSKTFGNMIIGSLLAATALSFNWTTFLWGFLATGICLWSGLYALNDWTDWEKDKLHERKKIRPIASGLISPKQGFVFSLLLIASSFGIGFFILKNNLFLICLAAMLVNQLLYTLKPFSLKKRPIVDLISGSLINPLFRFLSGWVLFQPNFNAPWELALFIVAVQFGGYSLYRMSGKELEKKLGYKSSVVVFGERKIKIAAYIGMLLGGTGFVLACFNGVLGLKYLWLVVLSLLLTPLYWTAIRKPQEMDMKKVYRLIYIHYTVFVIGFILIYFYF